MTSHSLRYLAPTSKGDGGDSAKVTQQDSSPSSAPEAEQVCVCLFYGNTYSDPWGYEPSETLGVHMDNLRI